MKNINWTTVRTFPNLIEAQIARTALESEGIDCFVRDEFSSAITAHVNLARGGVRLDVPANEAERAARILAAGAAGPDPLQCETCGGQGEEIAETKRRFIDVIATLFTIVPARVLKRKIRCQKCGREWRR